MSIPYLGSSRLNPVRSVHSTHWMEAAWHQSRYECVAKQNIAAAAGNRTPVVPPAASHYTYIAIQTRFPTVYISLIQALIFSIL
jgi:hypothetical protein